MNIVKTTLLSLCAVAILITLTSMKMDRKKEVGAFLQITLEVKSENRNSAGAVYMKYKQPFLDQIDGAISKELLIRSDDVQVIHGFETAAQAEAYLGTALFEKDVVRELKPYLEAGPDVRVYSVFK